MCVCVPQRFNSSSKRAAEVMRWRPSKVRNLPNRKSREILIVASINKDHLSLLFGPPIVKHYFGFQFTSLLLIFLCVFSRAPCGKLAAFPNPVTFEGPPELADEIRVGPLTMAKLLNFGRTTCVPHLCNQYVSRFHNCYKICVCVCVCVGGGRGLRKCLNVSCFFLFHYCKSSEP